MAAGRGLAAAEDHESRDYLRACEADSAAASGRRTLSKPRPPRSGTHRGRPATRRPRRSLTSGRMPQGRGSKIDRTAAQIVQPRCVRPPAACGIRGRPAERPAPGAGPPGGRPTSSRHVARTGRQLPSQNPAPTSLLHIRSMLPCLVAQAVCRTPGPRVAVLTVVHYLPASPWRRQRQPCARGDRITQAGVEHGSLLIVILAGITRPTTHVGSNGESGLGLVITPNPDKFMQAASRGVYKK